MRKKKLEMLTWKNWLNSFEKYDEQSHWYLKDDVPTETCDQCNGTGIDEVDSYKYDCDQCGATGEISLSNECYVENDEIFTMNELRERFQEEKHITEMKAYDWEAYKFFLNRRLAKWRKDNGK